MTESNVNVCPICGRPIGDCDVDAHLAVIRKDDPGFGFDLKTPVDTRHGESSVSPRLGTHLDGMGRVVTTVAAVTHKGT